MGSLIKKRRKRMRKKKHKKLLNAPKPKRLRLLQTLRKLKKQPLLPKLQPKRTPLLWAPVSTLKPSLLRLSHPLHLRKPKSMRKPWWKPKLLPLKLPIVDWLEQHHTCSLRSPLQRQQNPRRNNSK